MHITARHIEGTEEGHDVVERYRKVRLPENVDDEKLNCLMTNDGKMFLKAPFLSKHPLRKAEDTPVSTNESSIKVTSTRGVNDTEVKASDTDKQLPEVIDIPIEHDDTGKTAESVKQQVGEATLVDETRKEETQSHKNEDECDKPDRKQENQKSIGVDQTLHKKR